MVAMDFFAALNCYDFLNQYCSNLLKNPTVRGLSTSDDQFACFAHLLTSSHLHWQILVTQTKKMCNCQLSVCVIILQFLQSVYVLSNI